MATYNEQEIRFADEDAFNDQSDVSLDYRIPVLAVRPTFASGRSTDRSLQNRLYRTRPGYQMPRADGTFEIEMVLCGAQVDTASGALAHTWQTKLLADALGGSDLTGVGGVAGAGATASSMTNATGTRTRGAIVRVGQAGDGRAEGQAAVIGSPSTALLTALPAAPAAGDVVRACIMLFAKQTLGTSKRFLLAFSDNPGMQFFFTGCHCAAVAIRITAGDVPTLVLTYRYAYWRDTTVTTPSAATLEQCDAAVSAGGSYFLQALGTATRPDNAEKQASEIDITLNLGLVTKVGEAPGVRLSQVTGYARSKPPGEPAGTLRLVHPYDPALMASYDKDGSDSDFFHFLATLSVGEGTAETEGRHVAIDLPRIYRIGERVPPTEWNTLQYQTSLFALDEGPDETTDLTRSFARAGIS